MSTLQALIEDYTGSYSDTTALTDWLTQGTKMLLNLTPEHLLEKYTSSVAITSGTTSLAEYRVLSVIRELIEARRVSAADIQRAGQSSSLFYATALSPLYALVNGICTVKPDLSLGTARMGLNTVVISDGGASYAEGDLITINGTNSGTATSPAHITVSTVDGSGTITAVSISSAGVYSVLPTVPATITHGGNATSNTVNGSGAIFTVTWKVVSVVLSNSSGRYIDSYPPTITFSAGTAAATATVVSGVITTITITSGGSYTSIPTLTIGSSVAYAVAYPAVAYSDSSVTGLPTGLLPALILWVAVRVLLNKAASAMNVSSALSTFEVPVVPSLSVTAPSWTDATLSSVFATTTIDISSLTKPFYGGVAFEATLATAITAINTALGTDEDVELSDGHVSRARMLIEKFGAEMQNALNIFQKELSIYQSQVQEKLENARLLQEEILIKAKTETDLNLQNEMQEVATEIAAYRLAVEKYGAEISMYGQHVSYEVNRLQIFLQKAAGESAGYLALIPALKAEYNEIVGAFQ